MTITSTSCFTTATGNGATTSFPFNFPVSSPGDVEVTVNGASQSSGFTVTVDSDGNGGNVTFTTAPASGATVLLGLDPSFMQSISFENAGAYNPASVDNMGDEGAVRDIYLKGRTDRSIRAPLGETLNDLPSAADRQGAYLAFDSGGNPIVSSNLFTLAAGATVTTRTALANIAGPANLQSAVLAESGREGTFVFDSSDLSSDVTADTAQGIYVPPSSDTTGASGAWVRQHDGPIQLKWFGAVYGDNSGANASANNAAIAACLSAANALKVTPSPQTVSGMPDIDLGVGILEISQPVEITSSMGSVRIIGRGTSHAGSSTIAAGATVVKAYGCTAFSFDYTRCSLSDLTLVGDFSGTEAEHHGVAWTQLLYLTNVKALNFSGDGFNAVSGTNKFPDCSRLIGCEAWYCRDGMSFGVGSGVNADCNVIQVIGGLCNLNRRWNLNDNGFLGNSYFGWECASGASTSFNDGVNIGCAKVEYNGYSYFVISGQETGASTNAPSGTTADNTWWAYKSGSGTDTASPSTGKPAWSSGLLIRAGGSIHDTSVTAQNVYSGCYAESDQGWAQITYPSIVMGGDLSTVVWKGSTGAVITVDSNSAFTQKLGALKSTGYAGTDETVSVQIGERSTNVANKSILLASTSVGAPSGHRLAYTGTTGDFQWTYSGSNPAYYVTGPNTAQTAGTGTAIPHAFRPSILLVQPYLATASTTDLGRRFCIDTAAPSSGVHAQGEWVMYRGSNAGQIGFRCTASGTPGTWETVYSGYSLGQIGYQTGAGGTVTQATSKSTGVTLNKLSGQVTMNAAALAAGAKVSFTVTNSACAATDIPNVAVVSGGTANAYRASVTAVATGSFTVTVENITAGSLSESPVIGFAVLKGVTA